MEKGDNKRGDDCGADVSKQQEEGDGNKQRALEQVALHGRNRRVDKPRAVVSDLGDYTFRQGLRYLAKPGCGSRGHGLAVRAGEHQHHAVDDFLAMRGGGAGSELAADADVGHVANCDRHAFARSNDGLRDFIDVADACVGADEEGLAVLFLMKP